MDLSVDRCMEPFVPPWWLRNGWLMTLYAAWQLENTPIASEFPWMPHIFSGEANVPLFGQVCGVPSLSLRSSQASVGAGGDRSLGTIIATYGIVGSLDQQKSLSLLRQKALQRGFSVVLFDWRAHGKSAELSPTLTSDGLYEGKDFIHIAAEAKALGCPPPFWFMGFSLGGQLALWAVHPDSLELAQILGLTDADIGGAVALCPNLDSNRSLEFLVRSPLGCWLEQSITAQLQRLAQRLLRCHPDAFDAEAIARADSILKFDQELVIPRLGFTSVADYYTASSPLPWLHRVSAPTFILYAADDPMFHPSIVDDLKMLRQQAQQRSSPLDIELTAYGGHVGYFGHQSGCYEDPRGEPWWAWNRILDWVTQTATTQASS